MRVYPGGKRINSSNYDPMLAWVRGASLAALNWQSWEEPLWTNEGKASDAGGGALGWRGGGGAGWRPEAGQGAWLARRSRWCPPARPWPLSLQPCNTGQECERAMSAAHPAPPPP